MLDLWYKSSIIYCLSVGTYKDSNADGVGDFRGLTDALDHIAKLGANCIWLLPFFPSPRLDFGYDVTDFYSVAPRLGTMGDFVEFSRQARMRGLRILIDLPLNHTSDQHPWFQAARSDPHSPFHDYYVWSPDEPKDIHAGVIFPGHQQSVWSFDEVAQSWYFHRFYQHQPDLNVMNPAVRDELERVMGFWLELGVSGFRIDAAPFLIQEVEPDGSRRYRYELLDEMRTFLSWRKGDSVLLAEANVDPGEILCFVNDHRMQMVFGFLFNQYLFLALARQAAEPLHRVLKLVPELSRLGQWTQFLRNHDELDLGRLEVPERREIFDAFAPDSSTHIYERGIRRRLAPLLSGDRRRLELAFSLMFSLPGSPVIYYGDEIGMGDDLSQPERWPVRTCMQWSSGRNAGFSGAPAEKMIHPVVSDTHFGYADVNVAAQERDPSTLLHWMRRLCQVRQSCPEIGWGEMNVVATDVPAVFAHRFSWQQSTLLLIHNLDDTAHDVTLDLKPYSRSGAWLDLFGNELYDSTDTPSRCFKLDAYGYRWLRERLH